MGTAAERETTRRGAFTLIELLIVVAIIALLTSLLIPALSRARMTARRVVCATHQNELLKATCLYISDGGRYPPSLANTPLPWTGWSRMDWLGAGHEGWEAHAAPEAGSYFPFLKKKELYLCPLDRPEVVMAGGGTTIRQSSYSMNGRLGLVSSSGYPWINGSVLPVFFEEDLSHNLRERPEGCFTGTDQPCFRHNGETNVGFADGHVQIADYEPGSLARDIYEDLKLPPAKCVLSPR